LLRGFLFGGNVLEELLDQINVGEDHAAAAVALEAYGIKSIAERVIPLVGWSP
jgi:hypothetical protein